MISSQTANIDGVELHYLTAGDRAPLILIHGYAETGRMWKPIIPALAERFTVIAPDLPGIGDSSIPADGLDMTTAAMRIHALMVSLGLQNAEVVGHDIGLRVRREVPGRGKKAGADGRISPRRGRMESHLRQSRHLAFPISRTTPEALVQGRERIYFEHFWNDFAADKAYSIPGADRQAYTKAYARPGRMQAGWAYFVSFQKAAEDFAAFARTKLSMPILAIGGEKANGEALGRQAKLVGSDVTVVVLKNAGHWLMEEQPQETREALLKFL